MLTTMERRIVFTLFCFFSFACALIEGYLVYAVVALGFTNTKILTALGLGTGVLFLCGGMFVQLIHKTFLKANPLSLDRLHRFASERCKLALNSPRGTDDPFPWKRALITNTLEFAEQCLKGWVPGSHFEFCVFVDRDQPLLLAYFDSNHSDTSRSMAERQHDPRFYVERGYEVTRLLQTPTSEPRIVRDTLDGTSNYVFTSTQQRQQVQSTILMCPDVSLPFALVVCSNEKGAFSKKDSEVISFVKYIGEKVRFDLIEGDFIHKIRALRPGLFA